MPAPLDVVGVVRGGVSVVVVKAGSGTGGGYPGPVGWPYGTPVVMLITVMTLITVVLWLMTVTLVGGEPGPCRARVLGCRRHRRRRPERVATRAPGTGHAAVVDEHRRAGLQHGLTRRGSPTLEAVVGDAGVAAQDHRGQRVDVGADLTRGDARGLGPRRLLRRVLIEEGDHLLLVARPLVSRSAVEARRTARAGPDRDGPSAGRGSPRPGREAGAV